MMNPWIESLWLGVLQGITEFLPVSSSGHLALAGILFGVEDAGLTLNVMLHAGTLAATAVVLRKRLFRATKAGLAALRQPALFRSTEGGQDALFVIVASIPTGIIGLSLKDTVESWSLDPLALCVGFVLTTAALLLTQRTKEGNKEHPTLNMALLLGVIQGLAVVPGVSRSGTTIALALLLGLRRGRAFELSMLMSLPAVLGAVILMGPEALHSLKHLDAALFGASVAFGSGIIAMLALQRLVVGGRFSLFALWTAPAALLTLFLGLSG